VISLSTDTIRFDTLFTTTGSVTHFFKISNDNDQKLRISEISLSGGEGSYFKINADGRVGPSVSDLEVEAEDSLYVFVTVSIDQSNQLLPFVVEDSIRILYNGNEKWVHLQAWGQNAEFMRSRVVVNDTTWTKQKPIVILGGTLIAEGAKLTIEKGTKIYLHADAPIIVDGTLTAIGEKYDSTRIIFQGDRLDEFYRDLPAAWPGIYFRETSRDNFLKQVIVRNAYQGIISEKPSSGAAPKVTLEECIIDNCYDAGIIGLNSSINAVNCLISNCGRNIQLVQGGYYNFVHCTDVAISNSFIPHRQPVLTISDFTKIGNNVLTGNVEATFTNCIFWGANGTVDNEVIAVKEGNTSFSVQFNNCLWKIRDQPAGILSNQIIENSDPLFETIETHDRIYNFRLKEGSPAINSGGATAVTTDLDGKPRTNIPDIGAYETTF
jgi:hypothetical protein